jgi:hypothetical protein
MDFVWLVGLVRVYHVTECDGEVLEHESLARHDTQNLSCNRFNDRDPSPSISRDLGLIWTAYRWNDKVEVFEALEILEVTLYLLVEDQCVSQ